LERLGYIAIGVANGSAAVAEIAGSTGVDLVLSDLLMPGMTGLELVRLIRMRGDDIPILIMSGYAADHSSLRDVPRRCLLSKPFTIMELKQAMGALFEEGAPLLGAQFLP
jgi:CheY-like chemotaxis protein